ncbi:hypothetical protein Tco_0873436 [Tanacetum coccineum]|uniref:t-SNARE coiled-coil homology domain-containing protein n=1 Tax=Tanacetum coccineum TaxID=301880 RepID=A0ABQ5BIT0_9ASTR
MHEPSTLFQIIPHNSSYTLKWNSNPSIAAIEDQDKKRARFTAPTGRFEVGESSSVVAARQAGHTLAHRVDYGFVDTVDASIHASESKAITVVGEVNKRVTDLAATQRQDAQELRHILNFSQYFILFRILSLTFNYVTSCQLQLQLFLIDSFGMRRLYYFFLLFHLPLLLVRRPLIASPTGCVAMVPYYGFDSDSPDRCPHQSIFPRYQLIFNPSMAPFF